MLAEIYGRETGCCGGRGGSMHLYDAGAGVLASVPIVASSIPLGVGAALASKQQGGAWISVAFLGDGSAEEGVFHESANFASVHDLPVIFVVENNLYSVYTPLRDRQPGRPLNDLAKAHGVEAYCADGNDVVSVHLVAAEAVKKARHGHGASMIFVDTYRWREHCGPNYDNDIGYRTPQEFEKWKAKCPVRVFEERLLKASIINEEVIENINKNLTAEIDEAFSFAIKSPFPKPETGGAEVYAER